MKFFLPLIVAVGLFVATPARAEPIDLGMGTIDLPPGAHMQPGHSLDSSMGSLVSSDGTPEIGFDFSPQHDAPVLPPKETTFFRHGTIDGVPWVAYRLKTMKKYSLSVWFAGPIPGIFGAYSFSRRERLKVLNLILRFHPNREFPAKPAGT